MELLKIKEKKRKNVVTDAIQIDSTKKSRVADDAKPKAAPRNISEGTKLKKEMPAHVA